MPKPKPCFIEEKRLGASGAGAEGAKGIGGGGLKGGRVTGARGVGVILLKVGLELLELDPLERGISTIQGQSVHLCGLCSLWRLV